MIDQKQLKDDMINFIKYFQHTPLHWKEQEATGYFPNIWTSDQWHHEVAKFFYLGVDDYRRFDPPNRLKHEYFKNIKVDIERDCGFKLKMVEEIEKVKDECDSIVICEVGRGIDIIFSKLIKNWKKYFVYDCNHLVIHHVHAYFPSLPIESQVINSGIYNFGAINEPVIVVGNHLRIHSDTITGFNNPNIKHIILNGERIC